MDKQSLKEGVKHKTASFPLALYECKGEQAWQVMPHWHEEMELLFLQKGSYPIRVNTKEYMVAAPAIMCIHPGEIHSILLGKDCQESAVVFHLNILSFEHYDAAQEKLIRPLMEGLYRLPVLIDERNPLFEEIKACYKRMEQKIKEIKSCGQEKEIFKQASYLQFKAALFEMLAILYKNNQIKAVRQEQGSEYQIESLKRVLDYIGKYYGRTITLMELSGLVHMNPQYFCRFFKRNIGKTVTEYLNDIRIEQAADRLLSTNEKVITIAQDCGFDNIGYFIRRFKQALGCTPTEYRRKVDTVIEVRE